MITVPEEFAHAAHVRAGEAGRTWVEELPRVVAALCARWGLVVDGAVMHGYLGIVVPVRCGPELCVLKVSWRDESTVDEATALTVWGGRGAVRLLDLDEAQGAMLLERLDAARRLEQVEVGEAVVIAGELLRRLTVPAPDTIRPLQDVAAALVRTLPARWTQVRSGLPRATLDRACALAAELGPGSGRLLVNYDLHYGNVLVGTRAPWLAIDPKVVAGDPEYGLAQLLWTRLEEIEATGGLAHHFGRLCAAAEVDPARARAWTLVRCVDYWLWGASIGLTYDPARCARLADWLL
jgi:streptomycin 6-kinase